MTAILIFTSDGCLKEVPKKKKMPTDKVEAALSIIKADLLSERVFFHGDGEVEALIELGSLHKSFR